MVDKTSDREKQESMEIAEAAREQAWKFPSFMGELFMGRLRTELIFPYPEQSDEDRRIGDAFLATVETFLRANVNPDDVDRTGELPPHVIDGLMQLGCFGMKIPQAYGGLGLSQMNYNRLISMVSTYCASTAVWLSAHQSIGVPQPLKLFGTPEQKQKYLPRMAMRDISAFALTEPAVGSDPAKMSTTATPTPDGKFYLINGEKLWCTNGPVASVLVVMARTPSKFVDGKEKKQITAFIVETATPGFEVVHRCDFMGLKGIQNGLLRFTNVKVPRENILWGEGLGLKLALITLNTGRLTLPAACVGSAKLCLHITREWANERVQWGAPIGRHDAVAQKIARMAADTFAIDSMTWLTTALADRGGSDIRLEAAISKLFTSERGWRIVDDTLQIRGGRGYETATSLRRRGEAGIPVERLMRDFRINTVIEGSSEILRLFIAREAIDPHMKVAGPLLNPKIPFKEKLKTVGNMIAFYGKWYPVRWIHWALWPKYSEFAGLAPHIRFVERSANRLARTIFHLMGRYQAKLEQRQQLLARVVDIGTELFAMATSCSHAITLTRQTPSDLTPTALADLYCRSARRHIAQLFHDIRCNDDVVSYKAAGNILDGKMTWLEDGIILPQ